VVSDESVSATLKKTMAHISEAESNKWTLRGVTPTWVDGKPVEQTSTAWSNLLEHPEVGCVDPSPDNVSSPRALSPSAALLEDRMVCSQSMISLARCLV
jgi:hypothetical protein